MDQKANHVASAYPTARWSATFVLLVAAMLCLARTPMARAESPLALSLHPSSSPQIAGQVGTFGGPARKARAVKPAAEPAGSVTLTFENLPEYTEVTNQYDDEGAIFFGANGDPPPFIVNDGSSSTNPTLSGSPLFEGAIGVEFVEPGTTTPTEISGFSVLVGYIDDPGSTQIDVYSCHGVSVVVAEEEGFNTLESNVGCIYGFVVEEVSYEENGFEIDNLSYTPGTSPSQGIAGGALSPFETLGGSNPAEPACRCSVGWGGDPVNTATGDFTHTWTDLTVPSKGPSLDLSRSYNSLAHGHAGLFGYGWSSPYDMHLDIAPESGDATVIQGDGAEVEYIPTPAGFRAAPRVTATLTSNGDGSYTFTTGRRMSYIFNSAGELTAIRDANGYETTLSRASESVLDVIDPSGHELRLELEHERVVSATDPLGRTVHYTYNGEGDLVKVVDAMSRTTTYTYDGEHHLLTWIDPGGGVLTNEYDASGRVIKQTDPMGHTTTFTYDENGVTLVTDPRGNVTAETYHEGFLSERTVAVGTPAAATWKYTYDPITGGQATATDPLGHTATRTYDSQGNVLTYADALGDTTTYTYDELNDRTSETSPLGVTTSYAYDGAGNLLSKSAPLGETGEEAVTSYLYEGEPGEVTSVTNPDGDATTYTYTEAGDIASETNPDGDKTTYTYDEDGELSSKTAPNGNVEGGSPASYTTHYAYDADGELTSETDPLGHTTTYAYDVDGNRVTITDGDGHTTRQSYDADNELTEVGRPDGSTLKTLWDGDGNMIAQINAAGDATTYSYDQQNRLVAVTDPDGHSTSYQYDAAGRKTAMVNAEGETTNYAYDTDGELTGITYSDGRTPSVSETYDADGDRVAMTDGSGTSTFTYDSLNRMTSTTDGAGATVGYEYDLAGSLMKLTYPNGKSVSRDYDAAGNLTSVTDWLGHTTQFDYDADANETSEAYPNGINSARNYDDADQLDAINDTNGASTVASFKYTRDANGDITAESVANGGASSETYTHNTLNQLTGENETKYAYDTADDPTSYNDGTQTFDSASELTSSTSPSTGITPVESPGSEETPGGKTTEPVSPSGGGATSPATSGGSSAGPSAVVPGGGVEAFHASSFAAPSLDAVASTSRKRGGTKLIGPTLHSHRSGDLLLAFVSAAGPRAGGQRVSSVAGGGLSWSRVAHATGASGAAEIWQARATARFASPVTARLGVGGYPANITVAAFSGSAVMVASHGTGQGHGSIPTVKLTAPADSLLWSVGRSIGQKSAVAPTGGQRLVFQSQSKHHRTTGWVQEAATSTAAVARVADTTKASGWSLAGVAIVSSESAHAASAHRPAPKPATQMSSTPGTQQENASGAPKTTAHAATADASEGESRSFTYNARGDRVTESTAHSGSLKLGYDQADRLISAGSAIAYAYNGEGLRVSKTVSGVSTHFVWNQTEPTSELLQGGGTYDIYGANGTPIEEISSETPTYLLQDQQGSTRLLADSDGTAVGRYSYSSWGSVTSHTGTATTNLQYDGQYADAETGYIYLRARYYDPSTGQFLTQDPAFAASRNAYGYASSDPLDHLDPLGLFPWSQVLKVTGIVVGVVGLGAVVCVATVGLGCPEAIGIGAGTLTAVATGSTIAGFGIDAASTAVDCTGGKGGSPECYEDYGQDGIDVVTWGTGKLIGSAVGDAYDLYSRGGSLAYGIGTTIVPDGQGGVGAGSQGIGGVCYPGLGSSDAVSTYLQPAGGGNSLQ
jgi:RHS repeat-associated protein